MLNIRITLDGDLEELMSEKKKENGLSWKEMLVAGWLDSVPSEKSTKFITDGESTSPDAAWGDRFDRAVISKMEEGRPYGGNHLRRMYESVGVKDPEKTKQRAKTLHKSDLFNDEFEFVGI